jgi:hypothetical protein
MHNLRTYLQALQDPFTGPVGKLGFDTFTPTSLHSGWLNQTLSIPSVVTSFAFTARPDFGPAAFNWYANANPLSTYATSYQGSLSVANSSTMQLLAQTGRVVCAGVRCRVRTAATSLPGRCGGIYFPDESYVNTDTKSFSQIQMLSGYRDFHHSGPTEVGGQVCYRPVDNTSFEFSNSFIAGHASNATSPILVVQGTGWAPGSFAVDISYYMVMETLGGVDAGGEDDYSVAQLT